MTTSTVRKNSPEIKDKINLWIQVAQNDLEDAKVLYSSKRYRNSFYLFPQSVEKANKALGLFYGKTEKDLKGYSHNQMKIHTQPLLKK